jgi:hypothetical protein
VPLKNYKEYQGKMNHKGVSTYENRRRKQNAEKHKTRRGVEKSKKRRHVEYSTVGCKVVAVFIIVFRMCRREGV